MISAILTDSYIFNKQSTINILDFLESKFLEAGWVVDKKTQETFYDKGRGKLYPCLIKYLDNTEYFRTTSINCNIWTMGMEKYGVNRYIPSLTYEWFVSGNLWNSYVCYTNVGVLDIDYLFNRPFTTYVYMDGAGDGYLNLNTCKNGPSSKTWNSFTTVIGLGNNSNYIWKSATNGTNCTFPGDNPFLVASGIWADIGKAYVSLPEAHWQSLGNKSKTLYVHSTTSQGETIYFSFEYDYENLVLKVYPNGGFDNNTAVDAQPGGVYSSDINSKEYFYLRTPEYYFPRYPVSLYLTIDSSHFFLGIFFEEYAHGGKYSQYVYGGQVDKFFNFNGGTVITGSYYNRYTVSTGVTTKGTSAYYVLYEGTWYGQTIASSVSNKQGFIDLVTPSNFTTSGYNPYNGEIFVTQQVAGVNLGLTDNFEYKPIGTVHNFYKHYGVTPALPMELKINGDTYWSIPLDENNRKAVKAVEA